MSTPDPLNRKKDKELEGSPLGGSFECQTCGETVHEARLQSDMSLKWKCSEGHISQIKEFFR